MVEEEDKGRMKYKEMEQVGRRRESRKRWGPGRSKRREREREMSAITKGSGVIAEKRCIRKK